MTRYCVYIPFLRVINREYIIMSGVAHYSIGWKICKVVFTPQNSSAIFGR